MSTIEGNARPRRDQAEQQPTWASGDFPSSPRGSCSSPSSSCDTADLHAGWRVLDVATGSGNAAIAAARHGCDVVGIDYVPALLERGRDARSRRGPRRRARSRATPRRSPSRTASFDAVTSVFGSMFAPDHAQAAAELRPRRAGPAARSRSPAGRRTASSASSSARREARPAARRRPVAAPLGHRGAPARALRRQHRSLEVAERTFTFRFRSAEEFVAFFRTWYGPTLKAFEAARRGRQRRARRRPRRARGARPARHDAIAIPATYSSGRSARRDSRIPGATSQRRTRRRRPDASRA